MAYDANARLHTEEIDLQACYEYWPCIAHYAQTWNSSTGPCATDYPLWGPAQNEVFDQHRKNGVPITTLYVAWGKMTPTASFTVIALSDKPFRWKKINP